ncbi:restriction endonuclease subunit S [Leeuwenhoekiella aequorea]|uniref:restriction endonuclease subunit S n=1 Tax=Leeuwenhoekiella aequorea TaxID=283736 RepID=UPI00352D74D5
MEENQVHIPNGWELESLGKVVSFSTGKKDVNQGNPEGDYPFFTCSKTFTFSDEYSFDEEALMVAGNGDVGTVHYYNGKFEAYQRTYVLRNLKIDVQFLFQLLKSELIPYLLSGQSGTTIQFIKIGQLSGFQFLKPKSKPEQTQIANILSKVDEAIIQTKQLIAKYTRIKTGLMQDLLTKGIDEHGNIRSEETHEFKDSPLGQIPKEWDYKTLGDNNIIELHNNKRKPISSKDRANMIGDYPYYGATGIIDMLNVFRVDGEFVLFGEDGDHFLKWVYQEQTILTNGKFNVSNHAHIVKGTSICSTKWIHYFFCHRDITFYLTRQGAGRFKLNKASLLSLPILLPKSKNEQKAIIDRIEKVNEYSDNLSLRLNKLKSLKTGLMQDLLSGKVRVNHLIKETANV